MDSSSDLPTGRDPHVPLSLDTQILDMFSKLSDRLEAQAAAIAEIQEGMVKARRSTPNSPVASQEVNTAFFDRRASARESTHSGSGNSSSDDEANVVSGTRRRSSLLQPVPIAHSKPAVVTTIQNQPSFSHIKLQWLTVKDTFKFWSDVNKYEQMHDIPLKPATLVDDYVRKTIITKNRDEIIDEEQFFKLSSKQLRRYIQKSIRPTDKNMFASKLSEAVGFWSSNNFTLTVLNFQDFFTRLCTYRREFEEVYEFLAYHNAANIPKLENKDKGIIKIFLSKIPCEYGNKVFQQLSKTKFESLDEFMTLFFSVDSEHYDISKESRKLSSYLPERTTSLAIPDKSSKFTPHRAHQMELEEELILSDTMSNNDFMSRAIVDEASDIDYKIHQERSEHFRPTTDHVSSDELHALQSQPVRLLRRPPYGDGRNPPKVSGDNSRTGSTEPNGCFKMLTEGRCDRPLCTYSHDIAVLDATAAKLEARLRSRPYKGRSDSALSAPSRLPPRPPPNHSSVHELVHIEVDDTVSDSHVEMQLAMLNHISSESSLINSVVRDAVLVVDTNIDVPIKCLLDSGALHASYIRKDVVDRIRSQCPRRIKPCIGAVILADKRTSCPVTELLQCDLFMLSPSGATFLVAVNLIVMETLGEEVIIGLPTIVSSLLDLYIESLQEAANSLASSSLQSLIANPWTVIEEEAPEDTETPMPCAFSNALHFLSISRQDAIDELHSQIDEHIAPEFRAATDVVNLVKTIGIDVFIPTKWEGVKGVAPIEFNWKPGMPERMKPNPRPLNPKLYENAKKEFDRLRGYFYIPSDSPIASCLVIAPKATKPFIRFCGDYATLVNKYIETGHYPIPHVFRSLEKITKYSVFLDIDLTNSFHQFLLGEKTRRLLSVQTPWGQYEPMFLPEGVPPASGILQHTMVEIFSDYEDWTIAIFDNLLVLASDYADAYRKLEMILLRCKERNLVLKFSKTWLGFATVEFFGYQCSHLTYCLTDKRKQFILEMPLPNSAKGMMRFLGCSLFFNKFMPNFAILTARLHDMTKKTFNWDKSTWTVDYAAVFEEFKAALLKATSLFYPDYSLDWLLRVDASDLGVGFVLIQIRSGTTSTPEAERIYEPLIFGGKKFSEQAMNWDTFNKEGYAMFYAIQECEYYLRGKHFTLEGDHRNLQWIEKSIVPKVIRWRIYMQGFNFDFNHIEGRKNIVADWQSRLFSLMAVSSTETTTTELVTAEQMLKAVHGGRSAHHGARRTWMLLNDHYPGHEISYSQVAEFISMCPVCQKTRLRMTEVLVPIVRHLKNDGPGRVVGMDYLSIGEDKFGNVGCYVVRNHFTKLIYIYATKSQSAILTATALFLYCVSYGCFDVLLTDPGSEFTSELINILNSWFGIHHRVSLVDRHESNGVEGGNKEILRHLRGLLCDERIKDRWSDPTVLGWVVFIMNSFDDSESGASPYALTFGSDHVKKFQFPQNTLDRAGAASQFLKQLDEDLRNLKTKALEYQSKLVVKRCGTNVTQNLYQPGDFVLFHHPSDKPIPDKLVGNYAGPYEVLSQSKNDVQCRHCALGKVVTFYVGDLKLFCGSHEDAKHMAMTDADQYEIDRFLAYRGDPMVRTTMQFLVRFADTSEHWIGWSEDLFATVQYEYFCRSQKPLYPLLFRASEAKRIIMDIKKSSIVEVMPGQRVFVDLRSYGAMWYSSLALPDAHHTTYVVEYHYQELLNRNLKIRVVCPIFKETFTVDHWFVVQYGSIFEFSPDMVLIEESFINRYPQVLPADYNTRK